MFTGLVQCTGEICARRMDGAAGKLKIKPHKIMETPISGESIAVNGACLTLEKEDAGLLIFHVMQESFDKTNLGALPIGAIVNMERALAVGDRLGGHIVSGHIDATGKILSLAKVESDMELRVKLPEELKPYLVPKGSICIDGISLTIASLSEKDFSVRIIPTTWNETALRFRKPGAEVNLEADLLGKYVRFQLEAILHGGIGKNTKKSIGMEDLIQAGFCE